jgi:hypothetical protein
MLALAGAEGFLGNLTQLWSEADQSATEWEPFLRAWYAAYGDSAKTAAQVFLCVQREWSEFEHTYTCDEPEVRDTLPGDLANMGDKQGSFTKQLGWALKQQVDARYGDEQYRVAYAGQDSHTKVALWRVVRG